MRIPACVVEELLSTAGIGFDERGVYVHVLACGPASMAELAEKTQLGLHRVTRVCRTLAERGWLMLIREGRKVRPAAAFPKACQERLAHELEVEYSMSPYKGEFLLKRGLDFLVRDDNFVDNARPEFLKNPLTGAPLEYDRYYLIGAAFEFNGNQHRETTETYSDEESVNETRAHDLMKAGASMQNNVALVIVTPSDLSLQGIRKLLPECLKLNDADLKGPYAQTLEKLFSAYRNKAAGPAKSSGTFGRQRPSAEVPPRAHSGS